MTSPRTLRFLLHRSAAAHDAQASDENRCIVGAKRRRTHDCASEADGDAEDDDCGPRAVDVRLVELIGEAADAPPVYQQHYGLFVWPSALVLAHYVASQWRSLHGKVIMELGCGTGLPGILAALCGNPKKVYLTDRHDAVDTKRNVEANIMLNGLEGVAEFLPLDWGDLCVPASLVRIFGSIDLILAADCFYNLEDFEKVIATVALIFRCSPSNRFVTTYQLRSINRSIAPLLSRWGMSARVIDKISFLPPDVDDNGGDGEGVAPVDHPAFESVYAYELRPSDGVAY